jgi:hypothetical protein
VLGRAAKCGVPRFPGANICFSIVIQVYLMGFGFPVFSFLFPVSRFLYLLP